MATELIGIELNLIGADGVYEDMQKLDTMVRKLGGRHKIELELGKAKQKILELNGEITRVKREIEKTKKTISELNSELSETEKDSDAYVALKEKIAEANEELKEQRDLLKKNQDELKDTRQEVGELSNALGRVKSLRQVFNDWSLGIARFGSALQSAGNALTRFSAPMRMLMGGAVMGAGYNMLNKATEGIKSGFSRYDTMKKYTRLMKEYETANYTAEQSRQELDASVQGLPIALDEAVSLAQRYTLSLGDMERGTKLAIATNNAFLASMATENQRYQGMLQMQDLLNGKDLNSREWMSLGASMGKAINEIGKEFGYTNENMGEFRQELYAGNISTKDFLDALEKVGTGEGALVKLAEESKNTWEAFFSRIGTAFSRVGYNVLLSLDKLVETASKGKWNSFNSFLDDKVIPSIDNLNKVATEWIDENHDTILEFVNSFKGLDWKGIMTGFVQGLSDVAGTIKKFADAMSGVNLTWLGKLFSKSGAWGWFLTVGGGLIKGTRHIWAGIGTILTALLRHFTAGKLEGGIFGKLMSLFGKKKDLDTAKEVAKDVPSIAGTFKNAFSALEGLIKVSGSVLLVMGTGFLSFKAIKSMLKDLSEIGDILEGMTWIDAVHGVNIVAGIGVMTKIFSAFGEALGPQGLMGTAIASLAGLLVGGALAGMMWEIKMGVQQIRDTIYALDEVADAITNMKGIGTLDDSIKEKFRTTIASINEIKKMFDGKTGSPIDRGQVEAGLPTFTLGRVTSLTNIANAIKQMKDIVTQFNQLGAMTIVNNPDTVIESVKQACDKLQGVRGPKNIDKHTEKVNTALVNIRKMARSINKLAGTEVNTGGFATFVQQIKDALADFASLSGELMLDIEVKLSPMFGSSVAAVKKNIQNAKKEIEKYKAPISYNIPVNITFSVSTNAWSAIAQIREARARVKHAKEGQMEQTYEAKGGLIYRAHGGGVPWKHRGTDTVPAMLTPGEYVHNKRAVSAFGIDFMRKVNNLDMKGAMNELMHRAGHMANINRGTSITNNYNNNQKVVINNSNAGAGYTFKTASRFVGAF